MILIRLLMKALGESLGLVVMLFVVMPLWLAVIFSPFVAVGWFVRTYQPAEHVPAWLAAPVAVFFAWLPFAVLNVWNKHDDAKPDSFWTDYQQAKRGAP